MKKIMLYIISFLIYIGFSIYNIVKGSQWLYDSIFSIIILIIIFLNRKWINYNIFKFGLVNLALISHNLGTLDYYAYSFGIIEYDNIVHFLSGLATAYLLFELIINSLHLASKKKAKNSFIDDHKILLLFLVISSVTLLGNMIELIEFGGYISFDEGEGIFFAGIGDSGKLGVPGTHYDDTMIDILYNTFGAFVGTFMFYVIRLKKKKT